MKLVSVMIPTYNQAQFVAETLESVRNQTYSNLEIIVADDASTDDTQEIIRAFASEDHRIKILFAEKNQGISKNFNRGFDSCTGEYVAFLGGDDLMLPQKIEKQVAFLEENPAYVYCQHDVEIFDSATSKRITLHSQQGNIPKSALDWAIPTDWFFIHNWAGVLPSAGLARASYYLHGRYDERLAYKHELLFYVDNHCHNPRGKWHTLPEVLGRYRVHAQNFSRQDQNRRLIGKETVKLAQIVNDKHPHLRKKTEGHLLFVEFRALLYGWHPVEEKVQREQVFRQKAGWGRTTYLKLCRFLHKRNLLFSVTRPFRVFYRTLYKQSPLLIP